MHILFLFTQSRTVSLIVSGKTDIHKNETGPLSHTAHKSKPNGLQIFFLFHLFILDSIVDIYVLIAILLLIFF